MGALTPVEVEAVVVEVEVVVAVEWSIVITVVWPPAASFADVVVVVAATVGGESPGVVGGVVAEEPEREREEESSPATRWPNLSEPEREPVPEEGLMGSAESWEPLMEESHLTVDLRSATSSTAAPSLGVAGMP